MFTVEIHTGDVAADADLLRGLNAIAGVHATQDVFKSIPAELASVTVHFGSEVLAALVAETILRVAKNCRLAKVQIGGTTTKADAANIESAVNAEKCVTDEGGQHDK
jgi:hypothetical protein